MTETINVYQRMVKAAEIIGSQQWVKDMENKQFKSIPIDAMRNGVRAACVKVGLVHIGPVDIDYNLSRSDERTTKIIGTCKFVYINADNPDELIEYESMGEAMDNGDKCTGKFITNLIKNHYKSAFDIGEQGKDDIDSYSNEEYYETDARIQAKSKQDGFFSNSKKPEYRTDSKTKTATPVDPERDKIINDLTAIVMGGGTDREVVMSMLNGRFMDTVGTIELKQIYEAVHPFEQKGGKA